MGLDVVRKHVESAGGSVEVESRPGRGTKFRIRMPLAWRDAFRDPRLSWGFETEPETHADGRRVPASLNTYMVIGAKD